MIRQSCAVTDQTGAAADPALPTVALATDPTRVAAQFDAHLPMRGADDWELGAIRVVRHKPGKRCLIEYDIVDAQGVSTLIGKIQAKRYGKQGLRTLESFWQRGFDATVADGISVPEPIGHIGAFQMWLQRKERGAVLTDLLRPGVGPLMSRVARAAHKIHGSGVAAEKAHAMSDELRILHERLPRVVAHKPHLAARISALLAACERLGASLPDAPLVGSHRDFYPDQILVDRDRVCVIDFDLYCMGDPGLDIGNFLGHITEHSLRTYRDASALLPLERALEDAYAQLAGEAVRERVRVYATLTLARHVHLSTLFPERQLLTEPLLSLCEQRLGIGATA